ncbi:hypothetical protein C6P46_000476 [Rhodotorula mucilaginosa]|uniref:Urease accessory protein UreF n=1 Tax=Rhodotorula mucilaginosa TaxID=5537 RepID=A0A9P7B379_RHOMI|nr:hypothetical protein C6P46_000476 [Rhodotorula mucilaginosa]
MKTLDVGEPAALNAQHLDLDKSLEDYLLLVLSDSNLPTGGFVASSGLESWLQHGYSSIAEPATRTGSAAELSAPPLPNAPDGPINAFISQSLHSYARLNLPLVRPAHAAVKKMPLGTGEETESSSRAVETAFASILAVDILCETMTLNHVARRASVAQGVALLTLYDRAFAPPIGSSEASRDDATIRLVARYRNAVKTAENGCNGHMSVAFGVLTAAIGVGIAVRMNSIGPYLAHRMLVNDTRHMISAALQETAPTRPLELATDEAEVASAGTDEPPAEGGDWWDDDVDWRPTWEDGAQEAHLHGSPATSWPLGEVVASRHDQLFSKVFNS